MHANTIYYVVGAIASGLTVLGIGWKVSKFFLNMDTTVQGTSKNVDTIMNNHLPHIYNRLGELKGRMDARED